MIVNQLRVIRLLVRREKVQNALPENAPAGFQERGAELVDRADDETDEQINENDADRDVENAGVEHLARNPLEPRGRKLGFNPSPKPRNHKSACPSGHERSSIAPCDAFFVPAQRPLRDRVARAQETKKQPVDSLIPWLLEETSQLRGIPFREVIFDATGKKVLPFDPHDATNERVLKQITSALDEVVKRLNAPASVIQGIPRINEVSSHFEDTMRELLAAAPGMQL